LPAELGNLTALVELYLPRNKLTSVPAELGRLTALKSLNILDNQLTSVPKELGNLKVGRCRSTQSTSMLKAPMVSALEAGI
jgi:Leucine-rich repeat (LRR) protein